MRARSVSVRRSRSRTAAAGDRVVLRGGTRLAGSRSTCRCGSERDAHCRTQFARSHHTRKPFNAARAGRIADVTCVRTRERADFVRFEMNEAA